MQSLYDVHTLALCHAAALNVWNRTEEVAKKIESCIKVIQGQKETFTNFFLQRLTSVVNRMIPNSETRQIIIKLLAY